MTGYLVRLLDGPAEGWEYHTLIEPDPVIAVARTPSGGWMRVLLDEPVYPGAARYEASERYPADELIAGDEELRQYREEHA